MQGPTSSVPTITDILKRIADDKALTLFNDIALTNEENIQEFRINESWTN